MTLKTPGILIALCTLVLMNTATAEVVNIPDPNLRAAIRKTLNKPTNATITASEMLSLTALSAQSTGVSELTGLEYATNLTQLNLYDNILSDVSALANLTHLTTLTLGGNYISDVSPLTGLTNLTELWLAGSEISDMLPLTRLTNLTKLDISNV